MAADTIPIFSGTPGRWALYDDTRAAKVSNMLLAVHTRMKKHPIAAFLVGSFLTSAMVVTIWVIFNWEYLPEWVLLPDMVVVTLFQPIVVVVCGGMVIFFLVELLSHLYYWIRQASFKSLAGIVTLMLGLALIGSSILPWIFRIPIDDWLKRYATSRYDVVIDAIEDYHADYGYYPSSLDDLVPKYLSRLPGIYVKFAHVLNYYPDAGASPSDYSIHVPYVFELAGFYEGNHNQTLGYCPVDIERCKKLGTRIDDNWVLYLTSKS